MAPAPQTVAGPLRPVSVVVMTFEGWVETTKIRGEKIPSRVLSSPLPQKLQVVVGRRVLHVRP